MLMAGKKNKKQIEHDPIVIRFGKRLREVRVARGMTQAQLAENAGVTLSYITRLENGLSAPGIDLVAKLAAALGTTPGDLLPVTSPPDDLAVIRGQLRSLFEGVMESEDRQMLSHLTQFLARLSETSR
jgi:transcriptional regulator with XRE-family HTH domain